MVDSVHDKFELTFEIFQFLNISAILSLIILQMIHRTHAHHNSMNMLQNWDDPEGDTSNLNLS